MPLYWAQFIWARKIWAENLNSFGRPKIWAQILRKMNDFPLKFQLDICLSSLLFLIIPVILLSIVSIIRKLKFQILFHLDMKKKPSFYRFQGHRPNAKSLVSKKFSRRKRFMQLIWSAKNLGERPAQIFCRPNFWELRYDPSIRNCYPNQRFVFIRCVW